MGWSCWSDRGLLNSFAVLLFPGYKGIGCDGLLPVPQIPAQDDVHDDPFLVDDEVGGDTINPITFCRFHLGNKLLRKLGIKPDQTVLDFGCGSGTYAIPAHEIVWQKGRVYAPDREEDAPL